MSDFKQDGSPQRWDAEKCIEALLAFEERYGRRPRADEARAYNGMPNHQTVVRWFGSWERGCEQATWRARKRASARSALEFAERNSTSKVAR